MMARCEECSSLFAVKNVQTAKKQHYVEVLQSPGDNDKRDYWLKKMWLCSLCLGEDNLTE